jgi:phage terminase small subunit
MRRAGNIWHWNDKEKVVSEKKEKVLTPKEKIFISEYLKDFNATQAAIKAGYSKKTAFVIGYEILRKPYIQDAIKIQVDAILSDNKKLALKIVKECEKIAFSKLDDFLEFDDDGVTLKASKDVDTSALESIQIDEMYGKAGSSVKKRIKQHDKLKALDILARYTELYKDTQVSLTLNINTDDETVKNILARHGISKSKD